MKRESTRLADPAALVASIRAGEEAAIERLYRICTAGSIGYYLYRRIGADAVDVSRDVFMSTLDAIRRGQIRIPGCLPAFLGTVARRAVATYIDQAVAARLRNAGVDEMAVRWVRDRRNDPEQDVLAKERAAQVALALGKLSATDRDVIVRFYVDEQPKEQIMAEMRLSGAQFRLLKSRAKAKFGAMGKRAMTASAASA